jgi:HSP20 family protein
MDPFNSSFNTSSPDVDLSCAGKYEAIPIWDNESIRPCTSGSQNKIDSIEEPTFTVVSIFTPTTIKENIHAYVEEDGVAVYAVVTENDQTSDEQHQYVGRPLQSIKGKRLIPEDVDHVNATAKFENGVLRLTFPKKPNGASGHQRIPIE